MSSLVDRFLVWWLRHGRYRWSLLRRRLCERRYLSVVLPLVNSLEDIEACLRQIKWAMDGPMHLYDSISYPQTVWSKKKDDCDGFASLAAALLEQWDPDCNPVLLTVIIRPIQKSHTVCVFASRQNGLRVFDNALLHQGTYQTYEEVVSTVSEHAGRLICWDVRNHRTLRMLEFHTA